MEAVGCLTNLRALDPCTTLFHHKTSLRDNLEKKNLTELVVTGLVRKACPKLKRFS